MLTEIINIDLEDGVLFELSNMEQTQHLRKYEVFREKFKIIFLDKNAYISLDLDMGIGDTVTSTPKTREISLLFYEKEKEDEKIILKIYPFETIMAEKSETILNLGTDNSRMKDFYDIYLLLIAPNKPDISKLYEALIKTWTMHHPSDNIDNGLFEDWLFTIDEIKKRQNYRRILEQLCSY